MGCDDGFEPRVHAEGAQDRPHVVPRRLPGDAQIAGLPRRRLVDLAALDDIMLFFGSDASRQLTGAAITIDGGMPQHGHGLPTQPEVSANLGAGRYQVEGMKFNMPGWWVVNLSVNGPAGADTVTFNLVL